MGKIKQSTNQVWVYMDDGMKEKLHRMASQDKVNMSEFVRRLVNSEIQRRKENRRVEPFEGFNGFMGTINGERI